MRKKVRLKGKEHQLHCESPKIGKNLPTDKQNHRLNGGDQTR